MWGWIRKWRSRIIISWNPKIKSCNFTTKTLNYKIQTLNPGIKKLNHKIFKHWTIRLLRISITGSNVTNICLRERRVPHAGLDKTKYFFLINIFFIYNSRCKRVPPIAILAWQAWLTEFNWQWTTHSCIKTMYPTTIGPLKTCHECVSRTSMSSPVIKYKKPIHVGITWKFNHTFFHHV